ncbi:MAG: hypothetical protein DMD61_08185 [Gemmatimonadetes bacterium]|nr:MAG: hypothetical protein DMD61_08185 [Gemmatimonadota bacterium]
MVWWPWAARYRFSVVRGAAHRLRATSSNVRSGSIDGRVRSRVQLAQAEEIKSRVPRKASERGVISSQLRRAATPCQEAGDPGDERPRWSPAQSTEPGSSHTATVLGLPRYTFERMARKKAQHVIPQSYLKPWCDPQTPDGMEPYVWLISKDGNTTRKRSPNKSFTETDMYTIRLPDGGREFVAAMSVRTKSQQTHWQETFDHQHRIVTQLEQAHGAPPRTSLQTAAISAHAHQFAIANVLAVMPPLLFPMSHAVLETDDELGFITSDRPCVIYNPDMYKWPPMYRNPGLGLEKTEVTLPLSPRQLLLISHHHDLRGYRPVPAALVDEINRRTRFYCEQVFVSWTDKKRPVWFDPGQKPADAWENRQT